ncbi:hypothetical protein E1B28_004874 [Marasmius oreades]|uniref:Uncharacterized protein n=1 Tax=Marasmius oreades TaxID=181124 RepID=A0A9P7UZK6_9AGAR|nr:uncharacterized protein E1B28_004874 [Marasmius oreades]KAG7097532.1 hypothetical protein E1B28_004874 [Marasmius oreades]
MTVEYVYALHDFQAEKEDEVSFKAADRIEVIEKDDLYGDGWWQGKNLAGQVGLFPASYTTAVPPVPPIPPHILEASTSGVTFTTVTATDATEGPNGIPNSTTLKGLSEQSELAQAPSVYINGKDSTKSHSQEMQATMTDVQQAIEQLGRSTGVPSIDDRDGGRSFSFASSRGDGDTDRETDTDFDMSDVDQNAEDGEGWHKGARTRLAEKARRAVEEAEKLEMMMGGGVREDRLSAPPIPLEMSDESEGEGDEEDLATHSSSFFRRHSRIPEEEEEEEEDEDKHETTQEGQVSTTERDDTDPQTATATRTSFPSMEPPPAQNTIATPPSSHTPVPDAGTPDNLKRTTPLRDFVVSPSPTTASHILTAAGLPSSSLGGDDFARSSSGTPSSQKRVSSPRPLLTPTTPAFTAAAISSPTSAVYGSEITTHSSPRHSATTTISTSTAPTSAVPSTTPPASGLTLPADPATWTLENVLTWLKQRGFDETVAEKFTEQEITGDVLLELDVQVLKNEIGIMAFGKRARLVTAINELKRGMGIGSDAGSPIHQSLSLFPGTMSNSPHSIHSAGHSRNQSQSQQSARSFPGTAIDMASVGGNTNGLGIYQNGDGIINGNGVNGKTRPSNLTLSPADINEERERDAFSENEAAPTTSSSRRRFFGLSIDSSRSLGSGSRSPVIGDRDSMVESLKEGKEKEKEKEKDKDSSSIATTSSARHARNKKSVDNGRSTGERLSIFGTTFGGSLGKSRKPPPRYSGDDVGALSGSEKDKSPSFHLPRLHGSKRPGSSSGPKDKPKFEISVIPEGKNKEKEDKPTTSTSPNPSLLRKRTSSYPGPHKEKTAPGGVANDVRKGKDNEGDTHMSPLKPGQSVLEQIGEPDHSGWMRKRGERYNSWKLRYFVLKGSHLYYLRSDIASETKIKGYINIIGYKVTVDENVNPGKYGFRIDHDSDKTHYFSSDEKLSLREWMKAIMKATIGRDYTRPVVSSCNIPTIPLTVAQAMNPAPRPPSPTARAATQKALRRENPNQLSSRDARVLMGLPNPDSKDQRERLDTFFTQEAIPPETIGTVRDRASTTPAPPRPSREARRGSVSTAANVPVDGSLIEWANSYLPSSLQITDTSGPICNGLTILRLAEAIKGRPSSPPVSDSAFPTDPNDDKLEGLFRLFDFLLDNEVKMGSVSINDIRSGKRDKVIQLLKALKAWEDKRKAIANTIGGRGTVNADKEIASTYYHMMRA